MVVPWEERGEERRGEGKTLEGVVGGKCEREVDLKIEVGKLLIIVLGIKVNIKGNGTCGQRGPKIVWLYCKTKARFQITGSFAVLHAFLGLSPCLIMHPHMND